MLYSVFCILLSPQPPPPSSLSPVLKVCRASEYAVLIYILVFRLVVINLFYRFLYA